jgi:nitrogen-fixing nifU-like protein
MTESELRHRVEQALEKVRPFLVNDGGDVEVERVTAEGVVYVSLQGACTTCPFSDMTMQKGIEATIKQEVPEVQEVLTVVNNQ